MSTILLGLRSTFKEDIQSTPAELVYGTTLRLPGEFFASSKNILKSEFVDGFRQAMQKLQPVPAANHNTKENVFIHKDMLESSHVFVRVDAVRPALSQPYEGPYRVLKTNPKYFTILRGEKPTKVSIDRLKPAFLSAIPESSPASSKTTIPPCSTPLENNNNNKTAASPQILPTPAINQPSTGVTTRYGRKVIIPSQYR